MIFKCLFWQCAVLGCFSFAWRLEQGSLSLEIGLNMQELAKNFLVEIAILQSRTLKEKAGRPAWTSVWFLTETIVNHGIVT